MRLNAGAPCANSKRKHEGQTERCGLLMQHGVGNAHDLFESLRKQVGARVARDDVYDACVLALSAKARIASKVIHLTDGATDARGLKMEIWG